MLPEGKLAVPGAEHIFSQLARLTQVARQHGIAIAGSVDRHFPSDPELQANGGEYPEHCMNKTRGQAKIAATAPQQPVWIENRVYSEIELQELLQRPGEIYIEKQRFDVFIGNRNAARVFDILLQGKEDIVVYGVVTEVCVDQAITGLKDRPVRVHVVVDAIAALNAERGQETLEKWKRWGVQLPTVAEILGDLCMPRTEYIYDPQSVNTVLRQYPALQKELENPAKEGCPAVSFPQCRKTGREIYRILSNQRYPHLERLLAVLDFCIAHGFEQSQLLQTRAYEVFDDLVSTWLVAGYFLKRGLKVKGLDDSKDQGSTPDLLVSVQGSPILVEVYRPNQWRGWRYFVEELRLGILHLDEPWDFRFDLNLSLISEVKDGEEPLWFDPEVFTTIHHEWEKWQARVQGILSVVENSLSKVSQSEILIDQPDEAFNLYTKVRLFQVERGVGRLPNRRTGDVSTPTCTYTPEVVFDRFFRKVQEKDSKQQAPIMIVDCSTLSEDVPFDHLVYSQHFAQSAKKHLDPKMLKCDMIVFLLPRLEAGVETTVLLVFRKADSSKNIFTELFGGGHSLTAFSNEIAVRT